MLLKEAQQLLKLQIIIGSEIEKFVTYIQRPPEC